MYNFIADCLAGDALLEDIDDYVERWHNSEINLSMQDYLGMTEPEYGAWVMDPECLPWIVMARRQNLDFAIVSQDDLAGPIAARSGNHKVDKKLIEWLKSNRLWE